LPDAFSTHTLVQMALSVSTLYGVISKFQNFLLIQKKQINTL
jgi:hypothetical protein